jgi:uncharacterized protein YciI
MRFSYDYVMADDLIGRERWEDPDRVRAVPTEHAAYWQGLELLNYLGGRFADRSGGLITFDARSVEEAEQLAADDPFVRKELLANRWLTESHVE